MSGKIFLQHHVPSLPLAGQSVDLGARSGFVITAVPSCYGAVEGWQWACLGVMWSFYRPSPLFVLVASQSFDL